MRGTTVGNIGTGTMYFFWIVFGVFVDIWIVLVVVCGKVVYSGCAGSFVLWGNGSLFILEVSVLRLVRGSAGRNFDLGFSTFF